MAFTFNAEVTKLVLGTMQAKRGWLQKHNDTGEIPDGAGAGAVTIQYIASVTGSSIVDGTVLTDGSTTTDVNGTYVDNAFTMSLPPKQAKSKFSNGPWLVKMLRKHADGILKSAQNSLIADLRAGTPGHASTLPTGQIDFVANDTSEIIINLQHASRAISYIMAEFEILPSEMAIALPPVAFGNFTALKAIGLQSPTLIGATGMYEFMNVPIYPIAGASNFGGANNQCMYVTHKDSLLYVQDEPFLHGGAPLAASDGTVKWITIGPYAHAIISDFFAEVLNPAS